MDNRNKYSPNVRFLLIANKYGQTRVSKYYMEFEDLEIKLSNETEIIKKCTARSPSSCSFFNHQVWSTTYENKNLFLTNNIFQTFKIVYRRFGDLFVILGISKEGILIIILFPSSSLL
jgi:hypothetical protein